MNVTTRFTEELASLAKSYSDDGDEPAAPEGGGRFAEHAMITLHGLRIFLDETYEMTIDRLEVMPPIFGRYWPRTRRIAPSFHVV
jgi:hypothetical protein